MSEKLIEQELENFLTRAGPGVLCIKGKWGVGKTYLVGKIIGNCKEHLSPAKYSYVSLFGIDSLDTLKYSIFENLISSKRIGGGNSVKDVKKDLLGTAAEFLRKNARALTSFPVLKDGRGVLSAFFFQAVDEVVICLDDLERRSDGLKIKEVMGLASYLVEQRRSKVMIILNDGELDDKDSKDFKTLSEKVITKLLEFAPTPEECVSLALDTSLPFHDSLSSACVALEISNIRILKKIEDLTKRILPLVADMHKKVGEQALKTTVLLGWAIYLGNSPFLEFIRSSRDRFGISKGESIEVQEVEWRSLLDRYGFGYMDDLDGEILAGIEKGYFDETKLIARAKELDRTFSREQSKLTVDAAWRAFHDSFGDEDEVVRNIIRASKENLSSLDPVNLDGTVRMLKDLGRESDAKDLIDYYFRNRTDDEEFFDLSDHPFKEMIRDYEVKKAFADKYESLVNARTPDDVIKNIVGRTRGTKRDDQILAKLSSNDWYEKFKNAEGTELRAIVEAGLTYRTYGQPTAAMQAVTGKVVEALKRIASESAINRRRVRGYKIDV